MRSSFAADCLRLARWRKYTITSRRTHATRFVGSSRSRPGNLPSASSRSIVDIECGTRVSSSGRRTNGDSTSRSRRRGFGMAALACPHSPHAVLWLMVADGGCAPPPMRFSTLALAPLAPARIERDCNVAANVADIWNAALRLEPFLDLVLDDLVHRRQRLLLVSLILFPIPLVLGARR